MSKKVFDPQFVALVAQRKQAYEFAFGPQSASGKIVMDDLSRFCRLSKSAFHENDRVHALLEGRREVGLRVQDYLTLSLEELCEKLIEGAK
jgi:hypothetical protein